MSRLSALLALFLSEMLVTPGITPDGCGRWGSTNWPAVRLKSPDATVRLFSDGYSTRIRDYEVVLGVGGIPK